MGIGRQLRRRDFIAAIPGILAAPCIARAAPRIIRIGHTAPDNSHYDQGARAFAAAVAADPLLQNVLTVDCYGTSQLGDDVAMLNACMKGVLDAACLGSSILAGNISELGVINAPYLFRNAAQARSVLDGPIGASLMEAARAKGLPVLAWGENGVRHITSNVPVRTLADLRGLKIRVPQSKIFLDGFRALGAAPAPLPFNLVREALVSGEFTAQENSMALVTSAKLFQVQKYMCLTGHIYDAIGFAISPDLMDDLTEPQRTALAGCARAGADVTRKVAEGAAREDVAKLRAAGMTIIEDVDLAGIRAAARPFLESLSAVYGEDRMKALLATRT